MTLPIATDNAPGSTPSAAGESESGVLCPRSFMLPGAGGVDPYLDDPLARRLLEFFESKGLAALKEEDRREEWYADWIAYQAEHRLYARLLAPRQYSTMGSQLDLLRLTRFLEVFAYCSPAHGYSLQVTFLGLFPILMGTNAALKQEAVRTLEAGGLFAFGVSEKHHGADLLGNEFAVRDIAPERLVANGSKFYIGNANCAAMVSILARKEAQRKEAQRPGAPSRRAPVCLFAMRPKQSSGYGNVRKIRTLGVRAAFVGEFEVRDHELPQSDLIAEGRDAWEAVLGTVTLGKFFLGFGSIGICEHAFAEAAAHLRRRQLYGKPVIDMPHIRARVAEAYARLAGMKLYAYRALDYLHAASAADRRYLLFNAVQKARVSTEGVKVMALLSECIGAKAFESETYFEMALRDAQLIPSLEGSTHINLGLTSQFIPRYFSSPDRGLAQPGSLAAGAASPGENPYLMEARTGGINTISFPKFLNAYRPLRSIPNVRRFARQASAFAAFVRCDRSLQSLAADMESAAALGQCQAIVAYGQLVAENAARFRIGPEVVGGIFGPLVQDFSVSALTLAALPQMGAAASRHIRRCVETPRTTRAEWDAVSERVAAWE